MKMDVTEPLIEYDKMKDSANVNKKRGSPLERSFSESEESCLLLETHKPSHPTSNCDTMIHLLKGNIGTGILAMPDALKNAGLLVGTIGLPIFGLICTHCMHMLVETASFLRMKFNTGPLGYAEVAEAAFNCGPASLRKYASLARRLLNIFLCITQLGFCCVYFVFVGTSIQQVCNHYFQPIDLHWHMAILLLPMILLNLVRKLKYLAPISLVANALQFAGLVVIFLYLLRDLPSVSERKAFGSWQTLPLYFGTAIYAFEGIGMVLPLQNNMKSPSDFGGCTGVLNTGMVIVTCLYTAVGFFGYLKYGDDVLGSITLNLPSNDILAESVKLMMAAAIFLSYSLQLYVPVDITWPHIRGRFRDPSTERLAEMGFRTALVIVTFVFAMTIPNIGLFISLVGAVSSSFLALVFPPVLETLAYWPSGGRFYYRHFKNFFIFVFGLVGFATGTYTSIVAIVEHFQIGETLRCFFMHEIISQDQNLFRQMLHMSDSTTPDPKDFEGFHTFHWFADRIGAPLDEVNFGISQIFLLFYGFAYRCLLHPSRVSPAIRHWGSLIGGLGILYFCFGRHAYYLVLLTAVCYYITLFSEPTMKSRLVFVVCVTFLSYLHLRHQFREHLKLNPVCVIGPVMMAIQKITMLAFSWKDACLQDNHKRTLTAFQETRALKQAPSLLEYFSYVLNFQTCMVGPCLFYSDYIAFIEGRDKGRSVDDQNREQKTIVEPSPYKAVFLKFISALFCAFLYFRVFKYFPLSHLQEDDFFTDTTCAYRLIYIIILSTLFRTKFYAAWMGQDAVCNASGLGFNGWNADGSPRWDLATNIYPLRIELSTNVRDTVKYWNIGTARWLRYVAFERAPICPTLSAYLLSCLWHGFHPGFPFLFLYGAFLTELGRKMRCYVRPHFQASMHLRTIYGILAFICMRILVSYANVSFILLDFWPIIRVYSSLFWSVHIATLILYLAVLICATPCKGFNVRISGRQNGIVEVKS